MSDLVTFLAAMPFWYWWVLAVTLLIVEIMTGTTYVLWPAAAAVIVGIADMLFFDGQWELQLFLFAALTVLFTIFVTPYAKKWLHSVKTDHENLNKRGAQKVGQRAIVETAFVSGKGKVRYADTLWLAQSEEGAAIAKGAEVEVTAVNGTTMVVRAV